MNPLISVIIPVYNTKEFLPACLDSVLQQTYRNLEIILIDDGSTDGSGKICDSYVEKDPRVQVIHQQNQGLSAARNAGLKIFSGAYVTFIDGDDSVTFDYVEHLFQCALKFRASLSVCSFSEVHPEKVLNFGKAYQEKCFSTAECLRYMLNEWGFTTTAWGKLYARELWDQVRFPDGLLHEDIGTIYRCVLQCDKIAYSPEPNYNYYQRQDSITNQKFVPDKLALVRLTDQMCDEIDRKFPELINVTKCRRMHARFSVLRQMLNVKRLTPEMKKEQEKTIKYLRAHKDYVLKNPESTPRDQIAMRTLLLGSRAFRASWNVYVRFKKN